MRQAAEGTMQLVIVSNGLRVFSRGTTDGNALRNTLGLFGADETVRSLCRDELMAEHWEEAWRRTPAGVAIPASVAGGTAQSRGGGTAQSLWTCRICWRAHKTSYAKTNCPKQYESTNRQCDESTNRQCDESTNRQSRVVLRSGRAFGADFRNESK